ncbi:MAG: hypothetical protein KKD73_03455 [Proteobacteria bacterium]|jgi:hypothetical protein|nr:hypothetical protein [Pseudomonadota bacterium]MBU1640599.1 hypothetical protein [Pseudomonadota bacterium]
MSKVIFLMPSREYTLDGIRSALGLAVENMYAFGCVMYNDLTDVACSDKDMKEYHMENVEWLRDMEGDCFTLPECNATNFGLTQMTLEELGQKMRDMEYIIPYGIMRADKS